MTEAFWGDIDSDEYTTLDSTARLACRRWILEDLVALHNDACLEVRYASQCIYDYNARHEWTK